MKVTIQRPTPGRIVWYATSNSETIVTGIVIRSMSDGGAWIACIGIKFADNVSAPTTPGFAGYSPNGTPGTWRYPERCDETIEVEVDDE